MAHFVPSAGTWYFVPSCQELQVKNCKSSIANQKLQVKNCKTSILDSLDIFFSRLNEWKNFQSCFVQQMFKNCRCPKSQPLQWNVLDDGFNDEKLDIWALGTKKVRCVIDFGKESLFNKFFCSTKEITNYRCPKSQPLQWNVLDDSMTKSVSSSCLRQMDLERRTRMFKFWPKKNPSHPCSSTCHQALRSSSWIYYYYYIFIYWILQLHIIA
jgi:hypothetical protein